MGACRTRIVVIARPRVACARGPLQHVPERHFSEPPCQILATHKRCDISRLGSVLQRRGLIHSHSAEGHRRMGALGAAASGDSASHCGRGIFLCVHRHGTRCWPRHIRQCSRRCFLRDSGAALLWARGCSANYRCQHWGARAAGSSSLFKCASPRDLFQRRAPIRFAIEERH